MEVGTLAEYAKKVFEAKQCKSLVKKYLTPAHVEKYKRTKTAGGATLAHCLKSGVENLDSGCGIYAADTESYDTYYDVFDKIIRDYHKVTAKEFKHPQTNFGDINNLPFADLDPDNEFIVSTRVRVGRTVDGMPFPPMITDKQRREIENKVTKTLRGVTGELAGKYYPLTGMKPADQKQLTDDHFLFNDRDRFLREAGGYRSWPEGRGIFHNVNKTFLVWVNEEDHLRIISMQKGGNLGEVYKRLVTGINTLEKNMTYARHEKYGFLTFCPTNLGTTLRASVHIRIPLVASLPDFKDICEKHNLQARGIHGEHTESVGGIYDISNKRRLGLTEIEAVTEMANGVAEIIKMERNLGNDLVFLHKRLSQAKDCNSLMKKHLTNPAKYKDAKTSLGGTLASCIRSGVENPDSSVGIYACDPEAYQTFSDVFEGVVKDYHKADALKHPPVDFGDLGNLPFGDLDPGNKYIISIRVRCGRSMDGFSFPTGITNEQRSEIEAKVTASLGKFKGELKGTYYPLSGMTPETQKQLTEDHFLFNDHDRFLRAAGGYRNWPSARGIYHNDDKTFLVWVNEEDHLRIISMQMGGNLGEVYKRFAKAVQALDKDLRFAHSDKLGHLTFCPTNLGTSLRASVHIKIPGVSSRPDFKDICSKYNLQPRGIHGEHTETEGGVFDISNKRRLGLSEIDAVKEMATGVLELIKLEKEMGTPLEIAAKKLQQDKTCNSLMKKHLSPAAVEKYKETTTSLGGTLYDCIKSGVDNPDSSVGIYACDPEAYQTFSDVFDGVVKEYHKADALKHPPVDLGRLENLPFGDLDPENKFIISTRVRCGRSMDGYAFPTVVPDKQRSEIETKVTASLGKFTGELKGTYYPLSGMTPETQKQLTDDHFLFNDHDRFLRAAGGYRNWPSARGIYHNDGKTFLVWVNEEDHLRIISMQMGGNLGEVYKRFAKAVQALDKDLNFAHNQKLGHLTFCPTNLGTSLRASVHMKIPGVSSRPDFKDICSKYNLQPRGIHGEHTESEGGVFDISNKRRLGLSEIEAVNEMATGVLELIKLEKEMGTPLEIAAKKLQQDKTCNSLMKKHLSPAAVEKYKETTTSLGGTLYDCIKSGVDNPDSSVGIYACDPEAYQTFSDVFDGVVKEYHKADALKHPPVDLGSLENLPFGDLDPENKFIISTRVRCGRSMDGYAFPTVVPDKQRSEIETKVTASIGKFTGELKGTYYPLSGMTPETQKQLTDDHFLFNDHDRFLRAAGGYRNWPSARGIYHNDGKTFLVWVNEEDHLRIISMQMGGNLGEVYKRFAKAVQALDKDLNFAHNQKLGHLTFCPTNLGTSLRASVHMKIPGVSSRPDFKDICSKYNLQPRGIHGEHTESEGGVFDISNKRRLGLSEIEAVNEMATGVLELIKLEKEMGTPLEIAAKKLQQDKTCNSLMKKHLSPAAVEKYKETTTSLGGTLYDCIKSGVDNPDSSVGIYACDPEAYQTFSDVFDGVVKEYHKADALKHPPVDLGSLENLPFGDLDPENKFIISTRVRCGRSMDGYAFPTVVPDKQRSEIETKVTASLGKFTGELKGTYYPLSGMTPETQKQLTDDHFLFNDHDRFLRAAGGYRNWPSARGIYHNDGKTFLVWVNEEDHLRIISMQMGGNLGEVYKRFAKAVQALDKDLTFAHNEKLGHLTFCPTNLGTSLRASVHVKIPGVSSRPDFKDICSKYNLQPRGIHGEHTETEGGVFDISNKRRLGLSEIEAVNEMATGVLELIKLEKEMGTPLEIAAKKLQQDKTCNSLMKKHLSPAAVEKYKETTTSLGGTLYDCIKSGVDNPDSSVGIYACDPEAYQTFSDVFDGVVKEYHKADALKHPPVDLGSLENLPFGDLDPENKFIISTRVRCGRSMDGYAFPTVVPDKQRSEIETKVTASLGKFTGELKGTYYPLSGMTPETQKQLTDDHFLFNDHDRFLRAAGGYRNWPSARGIYHNDGKTFLVWVNEEDHLRIISMQMGGNLGEVYKRFAKAVQALDKDLNFAHNQKLGHLTFCPTNLGTSLRASVHMKIPGVSSRPDFKDICSKYNLQPRGIHGEHTESEGGVFDISNKRRLGLSEIEAVNEMATGVLELIKLEKEMGTPLEIAAKKLQQDKTCNSLMKKHLSPAAVEKYKETTTSLGGTLYDCIKSGVDNPDSSVGIYACDPEAYQTFSDVFDGVVKEYHKADALKHPPVDLGSLENLPFGDLDPEKKFIISTRVRCGRSMDGYAFPTVVPDKQRSEIETKVTASLGKFTGELKGTYYPLSGMTPETQKQLTDDHFLFNDHDRFLRAAGGYRNWPSARGIYHNDGKTFLVWVNEEDHLRIISMQMGGNLGEVYKRFAKAVQALDNDLTFAHNEKLGHLTFCPTNLGTSLRASVHMKIPGVSSRPDFKDICSKYNLQPRGIHGEHTESEGGVFDISNKRRLGLSEIDAVNEMAIGVAALIDLERQLCDGSQQQTV